MALLVNLRHLDAHNVDLEGELSLESLDVDPHDEAIRLTRPLKYELEIQELDDSLLLQGSLSLTLDCECVRCLKPFQYHLQLAPWSLLLPLEGEDAVPVTNDCVDLTPYLREDILLELPQHPLCDTECQGLPKPSAGPVSHSDSAGRSDTGSPAWDELNKLKF
jgi:uncharacterized protein